MMNTDDKKIVDVDLWEPDDFDPDKQLISVPDATTKAEDVQSDPIGDEGVSHAVKEKETDRSKAAAEPIRSSQRSAVTTEREKLMKVAMENGGICLKGGTLFRYRTPGGEPRVGFAVTGQSESDVRATSAIYERMCNPYLGFTTYEGVSNLNDCHVYSFQLYGDCQSVYNEVCNNRDDPEQEVVDSNQLLKQLAQTIFCHSSICGNTYVPLNCIGPHTVFVQRSVPDGPRVVILPLVAPRGGKELPDGAGLDATADLSDACMLVCEVWSGGFQCDNYPVRSPGGENNELIDRALSGLATNRPTIQEFAAKLDLVRLPVVKPAVNKTPNGGKSFKEWLTGLIPALGSWLKTNGPVKGCDGTWRKDD